MHEGFYLSYIFFAITIMSALYITHFRNLSLFSFIASAEGIDVRRGKSGLAGANGLVSNKPLRKALSGRVWGTSG